ncbi:MAG: hypothetical protein JXR94_02575 [Candidatus Hydrogenedentes bacterium]|nr:hypothetical protein [Candidatus Hydrogenedentota bacterium]
MYVFAKLDDEGLERVQELERLTGMRLVALTDVALDPASLPADMLDRLQGLEEELGMCLLAVR